MPDHQYTPDSSSDYEASGKANTVDWDVIIQTIKDEKCILCLGPEIYRDQDGKMLEDQMVEFLQVEQNSDIRNFYPQEGVFLFNSEEGRTHIYYKLRRFFENSFSEAEKILEKVAQIPFHFVINLTPDKKLEAAFQDQDLACKADFYWKNRTLTTGAKVPTKKSPLIYNLFGSIEERDSLVLTYQDLFDYFDSILGNRSMPQELKNVISETDNFIFLGIQFERWYMQLLLRVLAKYTKKDSFLRYAAGPQVAEKIKVFCQQQFRIHFVEDHATSFIDRLHHEMGKRDLLRKAGEKQESVLRKIAKLIAKAELQQAITEFKIFLEELGDTAEDLIDDLSVQESRFSRLKRRLQNSSIDERDAEVRQNQIVEAVLEILNQAKAFE